MSSKQRPPTVIGNRNEDRAEVPAPLPNAGHTRPPPYAGELAIPHEVKDPITGVVQGPALRAARERRAAEDPTADIVHLAERLDAAEHRANAAEKSREELLLKVIDMAERGFSAKLDVGKKAADEGLTARRDWRGAFIKVLMLIAAAIAGAFAAVSAAGGKR